MISERDFVLRLLSSNEGHLNYGIDTAKKMYKEICENTSEELVGEGEIIVKVGAIDDIIKDIDDNQNLFNEQLSGEGLLVIDNFRQKLEKLKECGL
jgi:hypothetical protein